MLVTSRDDFLVRRPMLILLVAFDGVSYSIPGFFAFRVTNLVE